MDIVKDSIESWQISNRLNLYLLNPIEEAHMQDVLSSKGRNVAEQFAHIHNVRLMWLKVALPDVHAAQVKIEKETKVTKQLLSELMQQSADAIALLLEQGFAAGKIKGFKPHPAAFLGYFIAHEAHHRSQIIIALKQSGHKVDQKVVYGLWEWGSR